jgi:transcriptional regulator with PAS, ATPase and Fis domain
MRKLAEIVERVAASDISVIVLGETGAGKEKLAEKIHRLSKRRERPFLRLNCAALSESLLESELFGHERGAFTGAHSAKPGLLEVAQGGTVFLDELGELPLSIQAKLLRVIEDQKVMRVGGLTTRPIDVRFISATNRNLEAEVARKAFRQDLFFRLNGVLLIVPPLRDRVDEIKPLVQMFITQASVKMNRTPEPQLSPQALDALRAYRWPGNIRELKNVLDRSVLLCRTPVLGPDDVAFSANLGQVEPPSEPPPPRGSGSLRSTSESGHTLVPPPQGVQPSRLKDEFAVIERQRILDALAQCEGNQSRAAKLLGISRGTLLSRLDAYQIARPRKGA